MLIKSDETRDIGRRRKKESKEKKKKKTTNSGHKLAGCFHKHENENGEYWGGGALI